MKKRREAVHASLFKRVFPKKGADNVDFERVLGAVKTLPVTMAANYRLPEEMESPARRRLTMQAGVKAIITRPRKSGLSPPKRKSIFLNME
jgi:hypothetical protein